ncbi:MAG: hypothetical protein AABZ47_16555 [Planctomycetota bacterium]
MQMLLSSPELRKALVEQRQISGVDANHQGTDGGVDLVQLALNVPCVQLMAVFATGQRDKPIDGLVDTIVISKNESLKLAQHPRLEVVRFHVRRDRTGALSVGPASRAGVVARNDVGAARNATLALSFTPERAATLTAFQNTAEEPAVGLFALASFGLGAAFDQDLCPVPRLAVHDGRDGVFNDNPVVFRHRFGASRVPCRSHAVRSAISDSVEFRFASAIPDDITSIDGILQK